MTRHRKLLALGGVAALVVLTGLLAFAAGSRAASGNICNTPTVGVSAASCVTELVVPHFISTATANAVSVTKFHNESGIGGANATHVLLSLTFPDTTAVTIGTPAVYVATPGSSTFTKIATTCTTSSTLPTVVSCPAGNIAGDGRAKMIVEFNGSAGGQLKGEAQYGEGGGNPSNPPNDDQVNYDTLTVGSDAAGGGCFPTGTNTVLGTLNGQTTTAIVGQTNDPTLPCTFADAGVKPNSDAKPGVGSSSSQLSFVEFPSLQGSGYATVTITFPSAIKVSSKTPIFEDTNYAVPYFTTFITVTNCDNKGNIVVNNSKGTFVGTPPKGETDSSNPLYYDSCVVSRNPSTNSVVLDVLASAFDQTYKG
jgi:hypothetical protein